MDVAYQAPHTLVMGFSQGRSTGILEVVLPLLHVNMATSRRFTTVVSSTTVVKDLQGFFHHTENPKSVSLTVLSPSPCSLFGSISLSFAMNLTLFTSYALRITNIIKLIMSHVTGFPYSQRLNSESVHAATISHLAASSTVQLALDWLHLLAFWLNDWHYEHRRQISCASFCNLK